MNWPGGTIVSERLKTDVTGSDHDITPARGTMRQVKSGEPGTCLNPFHYPLEAVCLECGRDIRIDRYSILDNWYHVGQMAS
jgi:hypothetical protein